MTKQLIALAFAAAFGIAHAADTTSGTSSPTNKGVGADSALGNVPQTTEPVGTNAPPKAATKTHKKHRKAMHKRSAARTDAAPAADTTK